MKVTKTWQIILFRWAAPSLIVFTILFFPVIVDEKSTNPLASKWLARIFFAVYLTSPFINTAKIIDIDKEEQFYVTDKDTLVLGTWIAEVVTFIMMFIVVFLASDILFASLYPIIYIFIVFYMLLVGVTIIYRLKLKGYLKTNK